jgi:uncharacterized protein (DUF2236 family)
MPTRGWTVADRINAERVVLLGWSRAILLQMAHPLIAAGVAQHSSFNASPLASAQRLHHTVRAMLHLTFGDATAYERTLDGIRAIHRRVNGTLATAVGPFPAGTRYSAEEPALLMWVHATLIESAVLTYDALVGPVSGADRDQYCREAAPVAIALGAHASEVPPTWQAMTDYIARTHASGVLVVGADAQAIASAILRGRLTAMTGPAAWLNRRLTAGWLPPGIRAQYGLDWSPRRERQFARALRVVRALRRATPRMLAHWRVAAAKRERDAGMVP